MYYFSKLEHIANYKKRKNTDARAYTISITFTFTMRQKTKSKQPLFLSKSARDKMQMHSTHWEKDQQQKQHTPVDTINETQISTN